MAVPGKWAEIRLRGRTTPWRVAGEGNAIAGDVVFEGYGPGGVALMVACRGARGEPIAGKLRPLFERFDGHLGADGAVAYLFNEVGMLLYAACADRASLTAAAVEAGAEDVVAGEEGSLEVLTAPREFAEVRAALLRAGYPAALEVPTTLRAAQRVALGEGDARALLGLLGALERVEEVRNVYTNAEISDAVLARVQA